MFGLEIEFITDKEILFEVLKNNNIAYVWSDKITTSKHDVIVLKPEGSLHNPNGIEINFPPTNDFILIEKVLKILNSLDVSFNERCALHVHVGIDNEEQLEIIKSYYLKHQDEIVSDAINHNVYINLNKPLSDVAVFFNGKFRNINLYCAFQKHKTVEHRIYKATINFDEVKFCVNQTLDIINNALQSTT